MYFLQRHSKALLAASWVLLLLGIGFVSQGQTIRSNPLTVGGQAVSAGQYPGTTTNDTATAGNIGEVIEAKNANQTATATFTNGQPTIGWTNHGLTVGAVVNFTTSGGLPTGFSVGTNYYVVPAGFTASQIEVSATAYGTAISASSAGTGTQTGVANALQTNGTPQDVGAVQLTAGQWECSAQLSVNNTSTTTVFGGFITTTSNSNSGVLSTWRIPLSQAGGLFTLPLAPISVSLAATTIYYLDASNAFSAGTSSDFGRLHCIRVR